MIFLFTDFGACDIYVGQVKAVLGTRAAGAQVVDLLHEVPPFDIAAGAHLLSALSQQLPEGAVIFSVVDPGVGGARRPIVLQADGRWFVGPDNGLLSVVAGRASAWRIWEIAWRPECMSASFHGRDLFAPIAAMLAENAWWPAALVARDSLDVAVAIDDLSQVIYVDHYGNCITGIVARDTGCDAIFSVAGQHLGHALVFSDVPAGMPFWYANSLGLVELALNCGSVADMLQLSVGMPVVRIA